jgi:hypothetical protein
MRKFTFVLLLTLAACQAPLRTAQAVEQQCVSTWQYGQLITRCSSWLTGEEEYAIRQQRCDSEQRPGEDIEETHARWNRCMQR